jgi:aryl-alcohol dehydrogenase-like predicted oxidoreductase
LIRECEKTLQNLRTDHINIYFTIVKPPQVRGSRPEG